MNAIPPTTTAPVPGAVPGAGAAVPVPGAGAPSPVPAPSPAPGVVPAPGKRGRGRPAKVSGPVAPKFPPGAPAPKPHGNELPPPALTPESRAAAIKKTASRLADLIAAEKADNPEAKHWRSPDSLFAKQGTEVKRSAWRPFVSAPVRFTEWAMGVQNPEPAADRVTDAEIDAAAEHWEAASIHLGLSPAGAAFLGAIGGTLATVGTAVARGFAKWWGSRPPKAPARTVPGRIVPAPVAPPGTKP